jgi:hypothetical protein
LCVLFGSPWIPASAQVNNPAYADYLLVGRFGEICTMCEAIVLCEAGERRDAEERIPDGGSFSLYHLQTRTFWSQIATIREWFIANFNAEALVAGGHTRPVHVYEVADGHWSDMRVVTARLTLEPATIDLGDRTIDRIDFRWHSGRDPRPAGFCRRLPLWESLDVIAARAPQETAA